ncbi:enhanced level of genomic instability 1 [Stomoxys calcitrans]|uniref:AAA+ ATPase domain-containing protein n=1 Tax=Stomoxys calcitrans TaxID=35570 RepID=A0A1I8P384_STOCA|nr:enhanced level of genomic instability 1 [Stomoxys calcitrans]XP_059216161.1 enhanced level of genomic instability 1 [Stomoxys calcitrans]
MTELKTSSSYSIESELKSLEIPTSRPAEDDTSGNGLGGIIPVVVSYPRIDSKLILQNMEEVLHTVKQQHKEKHRRKKELKKLAMIEAANNSSNSMEGKEEEAISKASNGERKHKHREKEKRHSKKRPLQEKATLENGKILQESPIKSGTILQHFQRTPKKEVTTIECPDESDDISVVQSIIDTENSDKILKPRPKVTNAFEVMMNARNKTIGSNTPGKDSPSPVADKETKEANVKRKLKLQEWAEQKGAAKRKLDEEARAAYVDDQLEQRAKRFKKMLVSGSSPKSLPKRKQEGKQRKQRRKSSDQKIAKQEMEIETKKRSKGRARRLSSMDSLDSVEICRPAVDEETAEFLAKLNSPTKKRDSLLGYFPKKESPKEVAAKQSLELRKANDNTLKQVETPRDRSKKPTLVETCNETPSSSTASGPKTKNEIGTPSGRPRRSCVGKTRYDFDLDDSPSKEAKSSKSTPVRKTATRNNVAKQANEEDSIDVIVLDDSSNLVTSPGNITQQGTPKKLAPLFVRSVPKPSPDPEILKARKAFLQSGVPEKLRLEQEKQKQHELNYEESIEIFPRISHVKQLSEEENSTLLEVMPCSYKLHSEETYLRTPSPPSRRGKAKLNKRAYQIGTLSDCITNHFQIQQNVKNTFSMENMTLPTLANKRAIIKNWKAEFERFPTFKCYNQMREKYRYFSQSDSAQDTEQVSESFVVTRRTRRSLELQRNNKEHENPDEEYKPPATAPNGELLFSEKYKPLLFEQVLVNLNPVNQLKEFLSNWSNGCAGSARNSQNLDDSMDFNDSSCSNQGPSCNTVVLLGPVSSGKTNAVFALANEMNFNVLEINAGMKRTGKKLMQELQEATQSHQIRKDAASATGSTQKKNLLKMSLNGLKSQMMRQNSSNSNNTDSPGSDSSNSELSQTTRKCLILIEDADIIFEQTDAGFTDAIYTLAASSKRPVIVVASNPNCSHLQRLMAQNTIHFTSPNVLNISKFLSVLSLIENCPVLLDDIISLYLFNNRDLRKTLLELQFFIQSGGDRQRQLAKSNGELKQKKEQSKNNASYFASPRKRVFSVEQEQAENNQDNNLNIDTKTQSDKASDGVYMHRSLFEFYTVCQNSKHRVPFPVDFRTFAINLNDIFGVSRKLLAESVNHKASSPKGTCVKRRSKSPKKQWLSSAMKIPPSPLENLCSFYENLSIASMLDTEKADNLQAASLSVQHRTCAVDRLNPNISEDISHTLLERAIDVNLNADFCPYNLFETPKTILSLCNELGTMQLRSKRARNLDYEPSLRTICRSEKIRSTQERRSTRFYHYLRTYAVNVCNFSTTNFDQACEVLQSSNELQHETNSQTNSDTT